MYTFLQGKDLDAPPLSHKPLDKNCGKDNLCEIAMGGKKQLGA